MAIDQNMRALQDAYEEFKALNERLSVLQSVRAGATFSLTVGTFQMTLPTLVARAVISDEIAIVAAQRRQMLRDAKDKILAILAEIGA